MRRLLGSAKPCENFKELNKYSNAKTNKRMSQWRNYLLQCVQVSAAMTVHMNS